MMSSGNCNSDGRPGSGGDCFLAVMTWLFPRFPRRTTPTRELNIDVFGGLMVRGWRCCIISAWRMNRTSVISEVG